MSSPQLCIGIDLVVRGPSGQETTDTAINFGVTGISFGNAATADISEPGRLVTSSKRIIGASPTHKGVLEAAERLPYDVCVIDDRLMIKTFLGDQSLVIDPAACAALILKEIGQRVKTQCGVDIEDCVVCITVPAYFDGRRKQATIDAAVAAGFVKPYIINEPTAAVLFYDHYHAQNAAKVVVVVDVGGGTTDVSVCSTADDITSVLATHGNSTLGGDDYVTVLSEFMSQKMLEEGHQVNAQCAAALRRAVTTAIHTLTTETTAQVVIPVTVEQTFKKSITRKKFESLTEHLTAKVVECAKAALLKAPGLEDAKVLMVGGACRMLQIQAAIQSGLGLEVLPILPSIHTAVGHGACVFACMMANDPKFGRRMLDQLAVHSVGIVCRKDGKEYVDWMIPSGTKLTACVAKTFTTSSRDQKKLNFQIVEGEEDKTSLGSVEIDVTPVVEGEPEVRAEIRLNCCDVVSLDVNELTGAGWKQATFSTSHSSGQAHTLYLVELQKQVDQIWSWGQKMEECQELAMKVEDMIDGLDDEDEQQDAKARLHGIRTEAFDLQKFLKELQAKVDRSDTESYHSDQDEDESRKRRGDEMSGNDSKVQKVAE